VKEKVKAMEIQRLLKNNPSQFDVISKNESISLKANENGLLGYFEKGTLPKEMEDVVFSLRINEISPIVESPYGYHIFKITRKKKERLLYLKNVKPSIKNKLLSSKLREAYTNHLEELKKVLKININYKELFFEYKNT
jgi:parvulin-like peptidyl-prolyl isomerase